MKTIRYCFILTLTLWTCSVIAAVQSEPDGDDERPELTPEEVQTFLKHHLPEASVLLEHIREQEPPGHYQGAMDEAAEVVEAYHETLFEDGKEAADRELRWHRIALQIEKLELEWRRASDEASRLKAREALRSKVVERFDYNLKITKIEWELLREEVNGIAAEIKDLETNRDLRIAEELEEIFEDQGEDEKERGATPAINSSRPIGVRAETISSANTTVVYPANGTLKELLAAKEVRRYIYLRSGQLLDAKPITSLPASGGLIVVAANGSTLLASLRDPLGHEPTEGQTLLKSVTADGRSMLVVSGADADATLLAAYRYAEKIGVGFDLAGDAIPDARVELSLSGFDEVGRPLFETRGIQPFHDFLQGPDFWNTRDYKSVISQLPKLGMNFIGLKTYPRYSAYEERGKEFTGPELTVWIGLPEDVNPDGTVKWSYPAYFAHTKRPDRIWGYATLDTDRFSSPARHIFDRNDYGSDVMGREIYTDLEGYNEAFNETGVMFKHAFAHAKRLGVKTAVGTELPMGVEKKGEEVQADWVRGIPPALQRHLKEKGLDPKDPNVVKEIYKGIFTRIMKTHDLDYYWLWTWEVWQHYDMTPAQIDAVKLDIAMAREALAELGNPFQIAMAGWKIGSGDNPAEFDDPKLLPYEAPIMGLWDEAESFEDLSRQRKKWPATWFEEDWGLAQPQLDIGRIWSDAHAALKKGGHGLIAKHWRTRILSPNAGAMRDLTWAYGTTSAPPKRTLPESKNNWWGDYYKRWAIVQFGFEVGTEAGAIFASLDTSGINKPGGLPGINSWDTESETAGSSPAAIRPNEDESWEAAEKDYGFVEKLEALRPKIVGRGNLERFDYFLKTFQVMRLMGEFGVVRHQFEDSMREDQYTLALSARTKMARLFEKMMRLHLEKVTNASDLGEIVSLEILNWHQLVVLKWDKQLERGLRRPIPDSANPSPVYDGAPLIQVLGSETQSNKGQPLELSVIALGTGETPPVLKVRPLGRGAWRDVPVGHKARRVYSAVIPPQADDFEYYLESGDTRFPVTAGSPAPIYQTVVVAGEAE